ncbi:MAG: TonB-dependent receptor [Alistipes sp.]|nr:TonB-dependent receptor [Alistipes sp.]
MRWAILTILLAFAISASAQETVDDYTQYWLDEQSLMPDYTLTDTILFYRIAQDQRDLFGEVSSYAFSFVGYSRRGVDYRSRKYYLDGIDVRTPNLPILRRLGFTSRSYGGLQHGNQQISGEAGEVEFSILDGVPNNGANVGLFFSGKGYLGGVRGSVNASMRHGWSMSAYVAARGGDDLYIDGLYRDMVEGGLRFTKQTLLGDVWSIVVAASAGNRGLRSGSTEEAFALIGNNLYNPLWGRQQGEERNSRVRREMVPFAAVTYSRAIGFKSRMTLTVGGDYGLRRLSSLSWFDASTPRPDNYRYMPSYYGNEFVAESVADEWRAGNERYTQIDWAELYRVNKLSDDGAVYALDDRVERIARAEAAIRINSDPRNNISISYGLRGRFNSSRHYRQMRDMLGASYLVDLDYYLIDDDSYSHRLQNDLRNPDRRVTEGDRYSYDYALEGYEVEADVQFEYYFARWRLDADLAVGSVAMWRKGYFEKELFPSNRSYGRSVVSHFTPYTVKLSAGYSFAINHYVNVVAMAAARAPYAANIYLNPEYNNRRVERPVSEKSYALEANYSYSLPDVDIAVSAYINSTHDGRRTFRAYDDLTREFCDVDVNGIATLRYGVEAAAEIKLSRLFRLSAAFAAGRYRYLKNPVLTHYADADNYVVSRRSESLVDGCTIGGAPQIAAFASLTYLNYRGWAASCSVQGVASRFVDLSFVRRTERVARQAAVSNELYDRFMSQSRLNDAVTVDASLSRWFRVGKGRISLTLSIKNLLGSRDIIYDGYEPSRIRNYYSGEQRIYLPQDDVVTYAYPRTFYAVVSWKF